MVPWNLAANQHNSKVAVCPLLKSARPPNHPARHRPSSSRRAPLRTLRYHSHVYRATPLLLWPGLLIMCMEHGVMRRVSVGGAHTLRPSLTRPSRRLAAAATAPRHAAVGEATADRSLPPPPIHGHHHRQSHRRARHELARTSVTTIINAPPCEGEHEAGTGRSRLCRPVATTRGRLGEQTMLGAVVVGDQVRPQKSGL